MAIHKDLTGETAVHPFFYPSESDPGSALGPHKGWVKMSTGELKIRNAANSGWIEIKAAVDLANHLADTAGAHAASAISVLDAAGNFSGTEVETILDELYDTIVSGGTPDATETVKGKAEIATTTETNTGTDDTRIVTPLKLAGRTSTETRAGVIEIATQGETDTGTDDARAITPAKLANYSGLAGLSTPDATETVKGKAEIATQTETNTGTDDTRIVTPLKAKTFGDNRYVINSGGLGTTIDLDNLGDVVVPSPATGDLLTFNGTNWVPVDRATVVAGGGGSSYRTLVTLGSDVSNSTLTYADITGLSFSVTSGTMYRFEATLWMDTQATSTGAAISGNGPASPTAFAMVERIPTAQTSEQFFYQTAYDTLHISNSFMATTNNLVKVEGFVKPSASGTFALRLRSEAPGTNNQVTVKAGSTLEYW